MIALKKIKQNAHSLKQSSAREINSLIDSEEHKSSIIEAKVRHSLVDQVFLEAKINHELKIKKSVKKSQS
jgi:hypothetical protein